MTMTDLRELKFGTIEEVMPEVRRLLEGHQASGSWTLGQILRHLSIAVRLSLDPTFIPAQIGSGSEFDRACGIRRRRFFKVGRFPKGVEPPLAIMIPPDGLDDRAEAESLGHELERLRMTEGPFGIHPWLGSLSKQQWLDFHRMHCEHHLGFARVTTPDR